MITVSKPAWLMEPESLQEITKYHLYMPTNVPNITNLQDSSDFISGMKQFLYWKGQLLPSLHDNCIFLAFIGAKGLNKPNVVNVAKALKTVCDFSKLLETFIGANTNFIAFSFTDKAPVKDIIKKFLYFEDSAVVTIHNENVDSHRFRLQWLPPLFNVSRVHHLLDSFSKSHRLKHEYVSIGDGEYSRTNNVSGTLTLSPGENVNKLPYLIQLPSPHRGCALLSIESRPPLCLKCRTVGHVRSKCRMVKCFSCHKVHFAEDPCGAHSYSAVASKGITTFKDEDWLSHLAMDSVFDHNDISSNVDVISNDLSDSDKLDSNLTHITGAKQVISYDPVNLSSQVDSPLEIIHTHSNLISEKCDQTLSVPSGGSAMNTHEGVSHSLSTDLVLFSSVENVSPELPVSTMHSKIPVSTQPSLKIAQSSKLDKIISSPPITRSQASKKQRIFDHSSSSLSGLRSEVITYSRHSTKKEPILSCSTMHPIAPASSPPNLDVSFDSSTSLGQHDFSDLIVDLTTTSDTLEHSSTRKRKSSPSSLSDIPSQVIGIEKNILVETDILSSASALSFHNDEDISLSANPDGLSAPDSQSLSSSDIDLATKLNLSHSNLIILKNSCPGHILSSANSKKLKTIVKYGIPALQASEHPHFFNLSQSEINSRLKILSSHQASTLHITDLFQTSTRYDRMQGFNLAQYNLPSTSSDPFVSPYT